MAKILSISAVAHDCGIAYIEDGEIKYAFEEERFKRLKGIFNQFSFPDLSLNALKEISGITPFDDDVIVVMPKAVLCGLDYIEKILEKKDIYLYDHHYSHACSSYFLSGFDSSEEVLILTYDGGDGNGIRENILNSEVLKKIRNQYPPERRIGMSEEEWIGIINNAKKKNDVPTQVEIYDDSWWFKPEHGEQSCRMSVNFGKDNKIETKIESRNFNSIASLWDNFCGLNGMFGSKDEGKIVGLAAQGKFNRRIYNGVGKYFKFNGNFEWEYYWDCQEYFSSLDFSDLVIRKDAAYMLQYLTENYFLEMVQHIKGMYPDAKKLALAGGLFSNVKVNQKINEFSEFDEIFISPGMSDGGLALGAAIAKANELGEFGIKSIDNVFWGNVTDVIESPPGLIKYNLSYRKIASYLAEGKVVGVFSNRREWGPRALGPHSLRLENTPTTFPSAR